jgi:hypothetical protein
MSNPLVAEMAALAAGSGLSITLVEEVAADIFMGTFTEKWRLAAAATSRSLAGTLYARYYDLPGPQAWAESPTRLAAKDDQRWGKPVAEDFAALCSSRAAEAQTSSTTSACAISPLRSRLTSVSASTCGPRATFGTGSVRL